MSKAVRSLLIFLGPFAVISFVFFLYVAGFFASWDGATVSVRSAKEDQVIYRVLVQERDGTTQEVFMPKVAIDGADLRIDPRAVGLNTVPEDLPHTTKSPFTLSYTVTHKGKIRTLSTASPTHLGMGLLFFLVGIGIRNMVVAGSPFSIEPRGVDLPKAQVPAGQIAANRRPKKSRAQKGPPPQKRRRGSGRRK